LLIETSFGRTGGLFILTGLQWTKLRQGATLQCNVDHPESGSLTVEKLPHDTPTIIPNPESIPWIFICAASAS
jgi:hypothetical protein